MQGNSTSTLTTGITTLVTTSLASRTPLAMSTTRGTPQPGNFNNGNSNFTGNNAGNFNASGEMSRRWYSTVLDPHSIPRFRVVSEFPGILLETSRELQSFQGSFQNFGGSFLKASGTSGVSTRSFKVFRGASKAFRFFPERPGNFNGNFQRLVTSISTGISSSSATLGSAVSRLNFSGSTAYRCCRVQRFCVRGRAHRSLQD